MGNYVLRLDLSLDLKEILSDENRRGAELILGGENLTNDQVASNFGDFISMLIDRGISSRRDVCVIQHEVFLNEKEDTETPLDWTEPEESEEVEILEKNELKELDDNVLQKEFIVEVCSSAFQIVSEAGEIETVLFNNNSVTAEEIGFALRKVVGIEIDNECIKYESSIEEDTCSIGYDLLGSKKISILKNKNIDGEGE